MLYCLGFDGTSGEDAAVEDGGEPERGAVSASTVSL